jgi:hypothetical protein
MTRKLDIRPTLKAADERRFTYFDRLKDDEKKDFIYSIVLSWANTLDAHRDAAEEYLMRFNERFNLHGDLMWKHPDLAFAMLASCGRGRALNHRYVKPPAKTVEETTLLDFLSMHWRGINQDEAKLLIRQMDKADFTELLMFSGLEPDQEKKIAAAYAKSESNPSRKA